jgi:transcriptional regulator with XRE-family HTH domain
MTRDVQARIRKRIRDRLDELRMTGRELAKACGHGDAWISGLLDGRQGLHWSDLDLVASKLGVPPSELVRYDEDELRELTPTEMRLLRHFQSWPASIKDKWLDVLDFMALTSPDHEMASALLLLREAPLSYQRPIVRFLHKTLRETNRQESVRLISALESGAEAAAPHTKRRPRKAGTSLDVQLNGDGLRRTR